MRRRSQQRCTGYSEWERPDMWRREPLVHFLLIGLALFVLDAAWNRWYAPRADNSIVVSEARVRTLAENFRRTWQRPPAAAELDGLIEDFIRDEVLTREAVRLGLDRDDQVIRRRLRQKMEIISEEAAASVQPTDEQLQAFLTQHADAFRGEAQIAFAQVFLDPGKRGDKIETDAKALLEQLNTASSAKRRPASVYSSITGDPLFVLKPVYPLTGQRELATTFGADFAKALAEVPNAGSGQWQGPVVSGYGLHLVRVDAITPGALPTLEQVRPLVEREWRSRHRQESAERAYQALRGAYQIVIKSPGTKR
jgi:hypothetical protein